MLIEMRYSMVLCIIIEINKTVMAWCCYNARVISIYLLAVCYLTACSSRNDQNVDCATARQDASLYKTIEYIEKAEQACTDIRWVGGLAPTYKSWNGHFFSVKIPIPESTYNDGFIDVKDISKLMHHKTEQDIESIVFDLFKNVTLPQEVPSLHESALSNDHPYKSFLPESLKETVRVDVYRDILNYRQNDLQMAIHQILYTPLIGKTPKNVIVLIQGHDNVPLEKAAIYFLEHGFAVILRGMPCFLYDYSITINGEPYYGSHDGFYELESDDFNPMVLFIEPNVWAVNLASNLFPGANIYMAGLSGGGMTSLLSHAFDKRITASIAISGWKPFFLRYRSDVKGYEEVTGNYRGSFQGDYEQNTNRFYYKHSVNYLDLVYFATRNSSRHYQVWVIGDTSKFGGNDYKIYADKLSSITRGGYQIILDTTSKGHDIENSQLDSFMKLEFNEHPIN